jgi:hypothetical protein
VKREAARPPRRGARLRRPLEAAPSSPARKHPGGGSSPAATAPSR